MPRESDCDPEPTLGKAGSGAEYALILAFVGAGIAAAAIVLGNAVATAMNDASTCISTDGVTCGS